MYFLRFRRILAVSVTAANAIFDLTDNVNSSPDRGVNLRVLTLRDVDFDWTELECFAQDPGNSGSGRSELACFSGSSSSFCLLASQEFNLKLPHQACSLVTTTTKRMPHQQRFPNPPLQPLRASHRYSTEENDIAYNRLPGRTSVG